MPTPIIAIAGTEGEIAKLDKEVLGTEGRLIGRVTELLRELQRAARAGCCRTTSRARWRGQVAEHRARHARRADRNLCRDLRGPPHRASAGRDRAVDPGARRRQQGRLDPGHRCPERDRRHRARRRSVPPHAVGGRQRARGRGARAQRAAARGRELSQAVRGLHRRHLCDDAGRRTAQRQSGAGADHGI